MALLPEPVADVSEGFFFPKKSPLTAQFNELIDRFAQDGTLSQLEEKWVAADEAGKTLPEQDWDAPNGTLKFATSGVIEPFSYVGEGGVDMMLVLDYRKLLAAGVTPAEAEHDQLSQAIVEGLCERHEQVEPGLVRLYLRS